MQWTATGGIEAGPLVVQILAMLRIEAGRWRGEKGNVTSDAADLRAQSGDASETQTAAQEALTPTTIGASRVEMANFQMLASPGARVLARKIWRD